MAQDREAVVWTRAGDAPMKMGRLLVTDTQSRFTYDPDFVATGAPGLGALYPTELLRTTTIAWNRAAHFDLPPPLQALVPPPGENFQRKLVLSYLEQRGQQPAPGLDSDWAILLTAGHGGIGHLDVFANDQKAVDWYAEKSPPPLMPISEDFGHSLKSMLTWMDGDAEAMIAALGPTPSVGGAIPKLLLSIPDAGWDGRIALPRRGATAGRTDVLLKFGKDTYPGIVDLEALTLDVHRECGFDVPRYWKTAVRDIPAIAVERFDRTAGGKPLAIESLYSIMAAGDARVTNHYSSSYDDIARVLDQSPIAIVDEPRQALDHLLKRLVLSFATGNGDLHLENLAILCRDGRRAFSPVFDPTPMRAYSRHNMLCAMPFGGYGEHDEQGRPIDLRAGLLRLAKAMHVSRTQLVNMVDAVLDTTGTYIERVEAIPTLPDRNKELMRKVVTRERDQLAAI